MGALTAVSFAYSLYDTAANPPAAYFITPDARLGVRRRRPARAVRHERRRERPRRAAVSWAGLAAIAIASAAFYTARRRSRAPPRCSRCSGALAVIWAGAPALRWAPTPLMERRPVQFLGDISYSVYLWHWPLLILAPFVIERELHPVADVRDRRAHDPRRVADQDPRRGSRPQRAVPHPRARRASRSRRRRPDPLVLRHRRRRFRTCARRPRGRTATAQILAGIRRSASARRRATPSGRARTRAAARGGADPERVAQAAERAPARSSSGRRPVCQFGVSQARREGTIALVGDSHASHWRPRWTSSCATSGGAACRCHHTSCPFSKATEILTEPSSSECLRWKDQVFEWFAHHPEVTTVFVGQVAGGRGIVRPPGADNTRARDRRLPRRLERAAGHRRARDRAPRHAEDPGPDAGLHPGGDRRRPPAPGRSARSRAPRRWTPTPRSRPPSGCPTTAPRRSTCSTTSATRGAATRSWVARWSTRTARTSRPCSPRRSGPTCSGRSSVSTRQPNAELLLRALVQQVGRPVGADEHGVVAVRARIGLLDGAARDAVDSAAALDRARGCSPAVRRRQPHQTQPPPPVMTGSRPLAAPWPAHATVRTRGRSERRPA